MPVIMMRLIVLLAFTVLLIGTARAQADLDTAIKATYLPKFVPFIKWPPDSQTSPIINICIIGTDRVADFIDRIPIAQRAGERQIRIHHVQQPDPSCHILYIAGTNQVTVFEDVNGKPILTVTDERPAPPRGIINFVVKDDRVRFIIDRGTAAMNGLTIDPKLLSLALNVE